MRCPHCRKLIVRRRGSTDTIISMFILAPLDKINEGQFITAKKLVEYFVELPPNTIYNQASKMVKGGLWKRHSQGKYVLTTEFTKIRREYQMKEKLNAA